MLKERHMAFPEHCFILDKVAGLHNGYAYWESVLLPDTAATSWNCCASFLFIPFVSSANSSLPPTRLPLP